MVFTSVLLNAYPKIPIALVMAQEFSVGEIDMLLVPNATAGCNFINASDVVERLDGLDQVLGVAPRWMLDGSISWRHDPGNSVAAVVIALDTQKEQGVVGRKWGHRRLGEVCCC